MADMGEVKMGCMEDGRLSSHPRVELQRYVQVSVAEWEVVILEISVEKQSCAAWLHSRIDRRVHSGARLCSKDIIFMSSEIGIGTGCHFLIGVMSGDPVNIASARSING